MTPVYKPEYYEFLYEKSSRNRILVTARTLFAALGYDNTSTAVIARNAGTSESQLMKHFGGKAGLLETIFTEGWDKVNSKLEECFAAADDLSARICCIPGVIFENLDQDQELKTLVLLEGNRMREKARMEPEQSGYARFIGLVDRTIAQSKHTGELRADVPSLPLRSAILGMIDGSIREQVLASRTSFPASYGYEDYKRMFSRFLQTVTNGGELSGASGCISRAA